MLFEALLFLATLLGYAYWQMSKKWTYWDKMGVFSPRPSFPFGHNLVFSWENIMGKNPAQAGRELMNMCIVVSKYIA